MNLPFKKILSLLWLFNVGLTAYSQTLHAILMADELVSDIGLSCAGDLKIMTENMQQISNGIDYQLNKVVLTHSNFTAAALREAIQKLPVSPQDVVFFYYSGHGYNLTTNLSDYPFLLVTNFRADPIGLDEIEQLIQNLKPRFCITMGDCCNNIATSTQNRSIARPIIKSATNSPEQIKAIFQQLFLIPTGFIKVSSSKREQRSFVFENKSGSIFTFAFESAFENCLLYNQQIQWETLLKDVHPRMEAPLQANQDPIFDIHLTDTPPVVVTPPPSDTTVVVPPPPPVPQPQPSITYADLNAFLGMIADETKPVAERQKAKARLNEFFVPNAHVKLYVNDTEVESQQIEQLFGRLYLNAAKISEVNVIQKASVYDPTRQRYTVVAVQEVWDK